MLIDSLMVYVYGQLMVVLIWELTTLLHELLTAAPEAFKTKADRYEQVPDQHAVM